VPDAKTVWLYREALARAGKVDDLFKLFDHCPARPKAAVRLQTMKGDHLARQGYVARGGQILDAPVTLSGIRGISRRAVDGPRNMAIATMAARITSAPTACTN
jgi:hypothetical protein